MKLIFSCFLLIIFSSCNNGRMRVISGLEGSQIPSFDLLLIDSTTHLNTRNIPAGQPFVLFYFSPFCPYCRAQTEEIKEKISSLKKMKLFFISPFPLNEIKTFDKHFDLSKTNNITVAQVTDTSFARYFKIHTVPYFAIYDDKRKMKEVLLGKVKVDIIKEIALSN